MLKALRKTNSRIFNRILNKADSDNYLHVGLGFVSLPAVETLLGVILDGSSRGQQK